jgi:beta-lactamase class A/poly(3-hydroxybutyrate) depolymerase
MKKIYLSLLLLFCWLSGFAQFKNASFMVNGYTLPYQIMFPENYDEAKQYPLLVFLHGAGERGNDNQKQLIHGKQFLIDNFYTGNQAIVIAPQCPENSYWTNVKRHQIDNKTTFGFGATDTATLPMQTLVSLVRDWMSSGKVDTERVYAGGLSMGGMGTLELLWRMPDTFSAAFPICGGTDLNKLSLYAKNTAVWLFHGDEDSVVPVENSRSAYKKLKELDCDAEYTEYKGVSHGSWINAFQEKGLASWLFKHKKVIPNKELRDRISKVFENKKATVGVALIIDGKDTVLINNDYHYPTQSVYKFHLSLAVLNYLDRNNLSLDHELFIKESDLLPETYSPLRDDHPKGNFKISVGELIKYAVAKSDNNGCDILFRFLGGPAYVDKYIRGLGLMDFAIATTEEAMHTHWDVQYQNWSTPYTAAKLLEIYKTKQILPAKFHDFLWNAMTGHTTGLNKIKASLPAGIIAAHKSGLSFRNEEGVRAADNDIAIVQLPDERYYSLAVFVSDSREDDDTNAGIIAEISKVVYNYLSK